MSATKPLTHRNLTAIGAGRFQRRRLQSANLKALEQTVTAVLPGLLVFGLAMLAYGLTLESDLSWANNAYDGGELITASYTLGVAHPPGYPTYILLGKLFSLLPVGTIAFRYNLFSAVSVAFAAGMLAVIAYSLTKRRLTTTLAIALAFASMPLVWGQAIVAEVYALNLAMVALFLYVSLAAKRPLLAGILLGLAITTHLTSLLLLPLALLVFPSRSWIRLAAGIVVGLTPLLALPLLAQSGSPVVWGNPTNLAGWWWLVSAQLYHANLTFDSVSMASIGNKFPALIVTLMAAVGVAASIWQLRTAPDTGPGRRNQVALWSGTFVFGFFALNYRPSDSNVLLLPGLYLLALALLPLARRTPHIAWPVSLLVAISGLFMVMSNQETAVRPLAAPILDEAPHKALIVTPGDRSIFSLWYLQHVEGVRPDLVLVDYNMLAFDWYRTRIEATYPELEGLAADDFNSFLTLNAATRPVCGASILLPLSDALGAIPASLPAMPDSAGIACFPTLP